MCSHTAKCSHGPTVWELLRVCIMRLKVLAKNIRLTNDANTQLMIEDLGCISATQYILACKWIDAGFFDAILEKKKLVCVEGYIWTEIDYKNKSLVELLEVPFDTVRIKNVRPLRPDEMVKFLGKGVYHDGSILGKVTYVGAKGIRLHDNITLAYESILDHYWYDEKGGINFYCVEEFS